MKKFIFFLAFNCSSLNYCHKIHHLKNDLIGYGVLEYTLSCEPRNLDPDTAIQQRSLSLMSKMKNKKVQF